MSSLPNVLPHQRRGALHWMALGLVWLAVAAGAVVFAEPAPVDVLTMMVIGLLPLLGLVQITRGLVLLTGLWMIAGAAALLASIAAPDLLFQRSATHAAISLYLYLAFFVFAGFVARAPAASVGLILGAYMWAAAIAAAAGIAGYFDLLPGAADLFTRHARASGTFKDPNVFGAFLVAPALYALHLAITRPTAKALLALLTFGLISLAILLSFSRGAWLAFAVAIALYVYLSATLAGSARQRFRLVTLGTAGLLLGLLIFASALQSPDIDRLFSERASLTQSYDEGPEGRFGGQHKALRLIAENPFGIGALVFSEVHHVEDVHNVYLSMFLNAGWIGGFIYALLVAMTCLYGFHHALKRTPTRPEFLVVYAAFMATVLEGFVIDTDHWRHFYLLMALLWGMMIWCGSHVTGERRWRLARIVRRAAAAGTRAAPAPTIAVRDAAIAIVVPKRHQARGRRSDQPATLVVKRAPAARQRSRRTIRRMRPRSRGRIVGLVTGTSSPDRLPHRH